MWKPTSESSIRPPLSHEEKRRDAGGIVAAGHIQIHVQENREAHVVGLHQLPCLLATVLRDHHDPMAVGTERLGQALQIRDHESAGGTIGLDEREQEGTLSRLLLESPIGSVQPGE